MTLVDVIWDLGWETQSCDCLRFSTSSMRKGSLHPVILSALHLFTLFGLPLLCKVCGSMSVYMHSSNSILVNPTTAEKPAFILILRTLNMKSIVFGNNSAADNLMKLNLIRTNLKDSYKKPIRDVVTN